MCRYLVCISFCFIDSSILVWLLSLITILCMSLEHINGLTPLTVPWVWKRSIQSIRSCEGSDYRYTPYSTRMSPENTHTLMGFYMEVLILGVIYTLVHGFCFFKLFPIGCIGLTRFGLARVYWHFQYWLSRTCMCVRCTVGTCTGQRWTPNGRSFQSADVSWPTCWMRWSLQVFSWHK